MILIDTHVLLWLMLGDARLGAEALAGIEGQDVVLSAISIWEIAMLADRQRLSLAMPLSAWIEGMIDRTGFGIVVVDGAIAQDAGSLPGAIHGDPGDRIVIATARALGCPLVTADRAVLRYAAAGHVQAIDARR